MRNMLRSIYRVTFKPLVRMVVEGIIRSPKENILNNAMKLAASVNPDGDYWEFGVFKGQSFVLSYRLARKINRLKNMKFVAFDSFKGLPEPTGIDKEIPEQFEKGMFYYSIDEFKTKLKSAGINPDDVDIIPGWYKDTLSKSKVKAANLNYPSVVYVDCILYESTKFVMNFLTEYLRQGTIILFDDWFVYKASPEHGEQRAVKEWLNENPRFTLTEYYKYSYHSNSFIVNVHGEN